MLNNKMYTHTCLSHSFYLIYYLIKTILTTTISQYIQPCDTPYWYYHPSHKKCIHGSAAVGLITFDDMEACAVSSHLVSINHVIGTMSVVQQ